MKKAASIILCLALLFMLSGCARDSGPGPDSEYKDYIVEIQGLEGEANISLADIYKMDSTEEKLSNISSSGEIAHLNVKGVWLDDILASHGVKQADYNGIRFYAGDGYSIIVPKEILLKKKIILFYEAEGEPMKEKHRPLRAGMDGERSMYWVGNLQGLELISEEIASINEIVLLDVAVKQLEQEKITYYDAEYKAVKTEDLIAKFAAGASGEHILLKSADGLEKRELMSIFLTGSLIIEGEQQPLFLSEDLPKGMYVKELLYMAYDETAFVSLESLARKYPAEIKAGEISVKTIMDALGQAESPSYIFTNIAGEKLQAPQGAAISPEGDGFTLRTGDLTLPDIISFETGGQ